MWIEQKANGKFLFREKYRDQLTGKQKIISVTLDKDTRIARSQAQKILLTKISKSQHHASNAISPIVFSDLVSEWFQLYTKQVRSSTAYTVKGNVKLILEMVDPDILVSKITTSYIRSKFETVMFGDRNISTTYARSIRTRLKSIFQYACEHGYLTENPINNFRLPKKKENVKQISEFFLEEDELNKVMNYLETHNTRYWLFCEWLYLNGLRYSEAAGMLKKDVIISEDRNFCKVTGALDYAGKKADEIKKINQTKTVASLREVDLNSKAVEIYTKACDLSLNSEYIFSTSTGTPIHISAIDTFLRDHKERMGIDKNKKLSSHIFRHTHISKLAELEVPLHIIQRRVGHQNESVTRDIYLHITSRAKDKTKKLLEMI